ncbi:MAG: DUF3667 domain-containing protein [Saprospiraceae bacterium]|nr:DUF3667 domain-containing protein [Saprospiraceae bacterium]
MSVWNLLKQLRFRVLHLESRSMLFFVDLFVPGKVTQAFFQGKQKRYPPPVQFFFVVMFVFLFGLNHLSNKDELRFQTNTGGVKQDAKLSGNNGRSDFYETGRRYAEFTKMRQEFDSLPEAWRTPVVRMAIDSLLERTYGDAKDRLEQIWAESPDSSENNRDSMAINLGFRQVKVATNDMFQLNSEEIIQKYGIKSWIDKMLVRQGLKSLQTPEALIKAYIGSLGWTILALIAFMSVVLRVLYWRQKRYYVEHFIFLLHHHSASFLLFAIAIAFSLLSPVSAWVWTTLTLWTLISSLLALKRFYGQGFWLTFFKWVIFSLFYLLGFVFFFTMGVLIVFFIY